MEIPIPPEPDEEITPEEREAYVNLIPSLRRRAQRRRARARILVAEARHLDQVADGLEGLAEPEVVDETEVADESTEAAEPERSESERAPERKPHDGSEPPDSSGPRGIAAVRQIMRQGGVWTAREVHDELARRGWVSDEAKHPLRATEAAINRLWRKNRELERVGRGQYRYVAGSRINMAAFTDQAALGDNGSEEP